VTSRIRNQWSVPFALLALCLVPVAAGTARLAQLARGAAVTPENERFLTSPAPVVVHIVCASLFCVLGAFQFVPGLRRRRLGWHRRAGRLVIPCGLAAALSGLWMTLFYALPAADDDWLKGFRLIFGSGMLLSLGLGLLAVRRRDIPKHRAWMTRGYAIGLGAGTQVLTGVPWLLLVGKPEGHTRALLMAAGWVINLAVAERTIRRQPRQAGLTRPGSYRSIAPLIDSL
jgi:uncharacterized membrane protein